MSDADDMHTVRNAAAIVLANIEHLAMLLQDSDPEKPLLEHSGAECRQDALKSLGAAERAARQLVGALRALRG